MSTDASLLKSYRFREEREADWRKLDLILQRAENRGVNALSDDEMKALPRLYRQAVSSLSVARSISLDQNVIQYLESLCTRGYFFVYGTRSTLGERVRNFFSYDWPEAVRSSGWATMLSFVCLFGGAALGFFLVMQDPDWFYTFNSAMETRNPSASVEDLRATLYTDPDDQGAAGLGGFAGFLFNNNAQIALYAFALGFMFGAPTAILLLYNGLHIGSFYAVFWDKGLGYELTGWLMIHGVTELYAIILGGTAGFVIGQAIAFPGQKTRMASAREAGKRAATIAMGCVVMLMIAALLEGFARQMVNNDEVRYVVAGGSLLLWLAYFYVPRKKPIDRDVS